MASFLPKDTKRIRPCCYNRVAAFLRGLLFLFFSVVTIASYAQNEKIVGSVYDPVREIGVGDAEIQILNTDSVVVVSGSSSIQRVWDENGVHEFKKEPAVFSISGVPEGEYILKIVGKEYQTLFQPITVKYVGRDKICDVGEFWLDRDNVQLPVAVVHGTRLLVVNKGDTLVYNVSALQTMDGDMLGELVKKLPDTEIRDGKIYVRGKFVEKLLIGGKDFFNGDIAQALRGLPAYTVNKIKIYDRAGDATELTGKDMGDQQYVMDVFLKKQYNGRWNGMLDAKAGTHKRFDLLGRILRFDDRQAVVLIGESNNLDEVTEGSDPKWTGRYFSNSGNNFIQSLYSGYKFEPNRDLSLGIVGFVRRYHNYGYTYSASEAFLDGSNLFGRSDNNVSSARTNLSLNMNMRYRPFKRLLLNAQYNLDYLRQHAKSFSRELNTLDNPDFYYAKSPLDSVFAISPANSALWGWIQSRIRQEDFALSNRIKHIAAFSAKQAIGSNLLNVDLNIQLSRMQQERFNLYDLDRLNDLSEHRHQFYDDASHDANVSATADYTFVYVDKESAYGRITPYYLYSYTYSHTDNPLYRLDWIEDRESYPLSWLPSEKQVLMSCLDVSNSFDSKQHSHKHEVGLRFMQDIRFMGSKWVRLNVSIPVEHRNAHMNYVRGGSQFDVKRTALFFNPNVTLRFSLDSNDREARKRNVQIAYIMRNSFPDLLYLIGITDASNPLNILTGNPNLRNTTNHQLRLTAKLLSDKVTWNVYGSFNGIRDAIAFQQVYTRSTGVLHRTPVNINGNWNADINSSLYLPVTNSQTIQFHKSIGCSYQRSVDLNDWDTTAQISTEKNDVKTFTPRITIGIGCRPSSKFYIDFSATGIWQHISGSSPGFTTQNVYTTHYSVSASATLPWDVKLKTEFDLSSRYGYSDRSMNKTICMWNMNIEKELNSSITFSLKAYDILQQYRGITSEINAQGRTETYRESLPSHYLFGLIWRFNKKHK